MKIGIIGTGNVGGTLARLISKAGHEVIISYSRDENKLKNLANELGKNVTVGTVEQAVQETNISILCIRFVVLDEVKKLMNNFADKIIIDANNPYDIKLPKGVTGADEILRRLPGIRLVKAFNTLYYEWLLTKSFSNPLTVMPVCSDDKEAKEAVSLLIKSVGFEPFDIGGLKNVYMQEPEGILYNKPITQKEAEKIVPPLK